VRFGLRLGPVWTSARVPGSGRRRRTATRTGTVSGTVQVSRADLKTECLNRSAEQIELATTAMKEKDYQQAPGHLWRSSAFVELAGGKKPATLMMRCAQAMSRGDYKQSAELITHQAASYFKRG
jgi:hypothetical protein